MQNALIPSSAEIRSMVTAVLGWLSIDLEYIYEDGKYYVIELGIWNITTNEPVFHSFVIPGIEDFDISKRLRKRGISKEDILNKGKTLSEINNLLKYFLPNFVCVFWNSKWDLRHFPTIKQYAYSTRCCMSRHAERHGYYNIDYGNHSYCKLENVASELGFNPKEGSEYHQAMTDAEACSFVWNSMDKDTLPGNLELVPREEVDNLIKNLYLENKSEKAEESVIPF